MEEQAPFDAENKSDVEVSPLIPYRRDGWTPFAQKLFLEVLAETGRVKLACEYCRLTTQSAYALRHRDTLFAAGWDAACELARTPLADSLYERAVEGFEETVTRNGEVVATRHRFDARLSVAVLNRLDKRCDRAEATGARHTPLLSRWDEWLDLVGKGESDQARALIEAGLRENSSDNQLRQLPLGENPTELDFTDDDEASSDPIYTFWQDDEGNWLTDFPPPDEFAGYERGLWGDPRYHRHCTPEESALLNAADQSSLDRERAKAAEERDAYFAELKAELSESE